MLHITGLLKYHWGTGPWFFFFIRVIFYPLIYKCLANKFKVIAISGSLSPISIMSLIEYTSGMSCERERHSRCLRTKFWRETEESIYPWGMTVKVHGSGLVSWKQTLLLVVFTNRYGGKENHLPDQKFHTGNEGMCSLAQTMKSHRI